MDTPGMSSRFQSYIARHQAKNPLADAAVALGIAVFPCREDKTPATANGFKDATSDPATIQAMFSRPGCAMIGVPTGEATGFVVIDVDRKENRQGGAWLDANSHRMPQTRTIRTASGGLHLYFQHPGQRVKNSNDKIAPGIDVRGDGGYVIVPPSPGYMVADDAPVADLPDWMLPVLCPPEPVHVPAPMAQRRAPMEDGGTAYGLAALDGECEAIRTAYYGQQEHTLNAAGLKIGALIAGGELREGAALAELLAAARSIPSQGGKRPWIAAELERKMRRAVQDGMRQPRSAEPLVEVPEIHPAAAFLAKLNAKAPIEPPLPPPIHPQIMDVDGVLKMIVDECTRTAMRPQPFLALGAAICAVGALAGRKYRTHTDLRTNIYVAAIAESGGGKDHAPEIIRRSMDAAGLGIYFGGETIASGRAVLSALENNPSRLFQVDEFGMFLHGVTGKKAAPHKAEIWSELMKLYSRAKGVYRGTEYANKKENPRIDIHEPHVCFYGTTTPSTFWSAIEGGAMVDGSLARFLVFISDNNRPERNKAAGIYIVPEPLIAALQAIARGQCSSLVQPGGNLPGGMHVAPMSATESGNPHTVQMDPKAAALHDAKLLDEDAWARKVEGTPQAAIVNRLGENASKLALVKAVSRNPANPSITEGDVAWAWALAEHCTSSLLGNADRYMASNETEARVKKVLQIIVAAGEISLSDLANKTKDIDRRDRMDVIASLQEMGLVVATKRDNPGLRPTTIYTPVAAGEIS